MKLKSFSNGYVYWCPGCDEHHYVRTKPNEQSQGWSFDGNVDLPTFNPSVKVTGKQTVIVNGEWTGEWVRGPDGKALDKSCHHFVRGGKIEYLSDCTHAMAGKTVDLPDYPEGRA
jgi:hypothetical protein